MLSKAIGKSFGTVTRDRKAAGKWQRLLDSLWAILKGYI
jgi:hypothetical protein